MIKPIITYGNPVLRTVCENVDKEYPGIQDIIGSMWNTLENADGCGLAAPQINIPIRLFIVNSVDMYRAVSGKERKRLFPEDIGIKQTFINAEIVEYSPDSWVEEEGCLSIPNLFEPVKRAWSVTIKYQDRDFREYTRTYQGQTAKIIQHEFDHTQGKLYIDYLSSLRKQLIKSKLAAIVKGKSYAGYPMHSFF